MSSNFCQPCAERNRPGVVATMTVADTPMCAACFNGEDRPRAAESRQKRTREIGEIIAGNGHAHSETEPDWVKIEEEIKSGVPIAKVAQRYGVNIGTMHNRRQLASYSRQTGNPQRGKHAQKPLKVVKLPSFEDGRHIVDMDLVNALWERLSDSEKIKAIKAVI